MAVIRKLLKKLKDQKGVTLIELLAVVVILGIIAAVAVPKIINTKADALKSTGQSDANVMNELSKRHIFDGLAYTASTTPDTTTSYSLTSMASEASLKVTGEKAGSTTGTGTCELDDQNNSKIGTPNIDASGNVTFAP